MKNFDAMRNGAGDEVEAFDGAARLAGEADDEGFFDDGGQIAAEDGIFGNLHGFDAHDFAEAGKFAHGDFADGFGCHVAQGDTGAAGGEDEVAASVDLFANGALDVALFVGDKCVGEDFPAVAVSGFF